MNNKPLQEFPQANEEDQGDPFEQQPSLVTRWMERLAHLGLGEVALRIGTNVLAVLLVVLTIWLLQRANLGGVSIRSDESNLTPVPTLPISQFPIEIVTSLDGIQRQAELHTTIPSRPRIDVVKYTVQQGDSIFRIADNYGLKPTTILFGNKKDLENNPNLLKPGQVLNILPIDGAYYEWQGVENLTQVATTYGSDVEAIINFPGNHLDPETIGDLGKPNITGGTWLILPGGRYEFSSWTPPAQLVRSNPSTGVWGPGVCAGIQYVQLGTGSFIYPTTEHFLSGTPYRPDVRHFAVDFAGSEGNGVFATDGGTVVYSGWNTWGYGNLVIVDHGNGWQSLYAHLSGILVGCGQNVDQGMMIGLVGMTGGTSTGPHLHFELMNVTLGKVNPLDYLPAP
jgi:murein DD-endopeptidase MepM/ murein hydrolase activator NlpD